MQNTEMSEIILTSLNIVRRRRRMQRILNDASYGLFFGSAAVLPFFFGNIFGYTIYLPPMILPALFL
jgi:hypothetical protein